MIDFRDLNFYPAIEVALPDQVGISKTFALRIMKKSVACLFLFSLVQFARAYDPIKPYASESIARTIGMIINIEAPLINYPKGPVFEVVDYLEVNGDNAEEFRVRFSGSSSGMHDET